MNARPLYHPLRTRQDEYAPGPIIAKVIEWNGELFGSRYSDRFTYRDASTNRVAAFLIVAAGIAAVGLIYWWMQ